MTGSDRERDVLTGIIRAVTDSWDEPLDEVHDVPQIVNAVLASDWLAEHEKAIAAEAWDEGWRAAQRSRLTAPLSGDNPYRDWSENA